MTSRYCRIHSKFGIKEQCVCWQSSDPTSRHDSMEHFSESSKVRTDPSPDLIKYVSVMSCCSTTNDYRHFWT